MTSAVMSDYPEPMFQEEHHLTIPIVSAEWPSVMKEERLTGAPILVENLRAVLHRYAVHKDLSFDLWAIVELFR
jgi:hypothetical protein